jgi:hypothetical protein
MTSTVLVKCQNSKVQFSEKKPKKRTCPGSHPFHQGQCWEVLRPPDFWSRALAFCSFMQSIFTEHLLCASTLLAPGDTTVVIHKLISGP